MRSEQRTAGDFVQLEAAPGVVIVVSAWMLDPVACAGMEMGAPRVAVAALAELHRLLVVSGFRRSFRGDSTIAKEVPLKNLPVPAVPSAMQPQLKMALDPRLQWLSPSERRIALGRLASILMEAAGVPPGERDDDGR